MERCRVVDKLAARAWSAAESIDTIGDGKRAWRWTYKQVERLYREGRQDDPDAIRPVVETLEERLAMERRRRREGVV